MLERFRNLIRRRPPKIAPPPPPPEPVMLPGITVVEAEFTMSGSGGVSTAKRRPGLSVEDVMGAATLEAMAAGVTDHDKIRELKLNAREDLKKARRVALDEKRPVEFFVGTKSFVVTP